MNKAVLVIDMPNSCADCSLMWKDEYSDFCPVKCNENKTDIYDYTHIHTKPKWCPLKPMPRMRFTYMDHASEAILDYNNGWNDCIGKIIDE